MNIVAYVNAINMYLLGVCVPSYSACRGHRHCVLLHGIGAEPQYDHLQSLVSSNPAGQESDV